MLNKNIYIYLLYVYTSMIPVNIQSSVCMYIVTRLNTIDVPSYYPKQVVEGFN